MFVPKNLLFKMSDIKKSKGEFCCAIACSNKPHPKKAGLCNTHYNRKRRIVDPVYNRYSNFKSKAKQRSKDFTITLPEFRQFCIDNDYIITKGMRGRRCTVDRLDNRFGYHIWNIGIKSNLANIRKYHGVDKHITELPADHEDYSPF